MGRDLSFYHCVWGPPNIVSNRKGDFPRVTLIMHFYLVPRFRKHGTSHPQRLNVFREWCLSTGTALNILYPTILVLVNYIKQVTEVCIA
jgi:hypothetical protein